MSYAASEKLEIIRTAEPSRLGREQVETVYHLKRIVDSSVNQLRLFEDF